MENFNSFLSLLKFGTLDIYKYLVYWEKDGTRGTKPKIHFEGNIFEFRNQLNDSFETCKKEIGSELKKIEKQFDKLQFIRNLESRIIIEQSLISKNKKGEYSHSYFHELSGITGSDLVYTEKDFQEYYETIKSYSDKVLVYLEGLRSDINSIYSSGLEKDSFGAEKEEHTSPINFFDDFILSDKIYRIWKEFINDSEEKLYYDDVEIIESLGQKKLWYRDQETGDALFDLKYFEKDYLLPALTIEYNESRRRIENYIHNLSQENQLSYLTIVLNKLNYLINQSIQNEPFIKYSASCNNYFGALVDFCKSLINTKNLDEETKEIQIEKSTSEKSNQRTSKKNNNSFRISNIPKNILALKEIYNLRINDIVFIDKNKTSQEEFIKYFTSKDLTESSIKIYTACMVKEVSYILMKMKSLFPGIRFNLIANYKSLITNPVDESTITASVIYKNNSEISNKNHFKGQQDIDDFFSALKNIMNNQ